MPVGDEEVEQTVVVEVAESRAPPEITERTRHHARLVAHVGEESGRAVLVERVVVAGEVGDEYVEAPVTVVVGGVRSHARLRLAVAAQRQPRRESGLRERPVPVVPEEQIWHGVVRDEDIRPAVAIEVGEDYAETVEARVHDSRRTRDVREGAVAVVAVEHVRLAIEPLGTTHHVEPRVAAAGGRAA